MNTNSGTLPQKAIAGYSGSYSGRFKTMIVINVPNSIRGKLIKEGNETDKHHIVVQIYK
jgi:uncharacterized membrane-anchored protein YitT (DUF2179 family)